MRTEGQDPEPAFSGVFSRAFLSILVLTLALGYGVQRLFRDGDAAPREVAARGDLQPDENATIELFERASPAVVYIESRSLQQTLWDMRPDEVPEGSGSGFLWDEQGHVVTNFHVVRGGSIYKVRFRDGAVYDGTYLGGAPDYDLAVIAIDAPRERLRPLPIGSSADLRVGQKAFAIGCPFGLEQTLTTGVISGLDRAIQSQASGYIHGVVQTDAAINPGNSGGPLLDSAGRLIGINTAIATPSGANAGVGFAVPVDTVNRIVPRILAEGDVERAGLGIEVGRDAYARDHGIAGAVVRSVIPQGPADRAGLQGMNGDDELGDVITGVNDQEIRSEADLYQALEPYRAGEEVLVHLNRRQRDERKSEEVRVRLGAALTSRGGRGPRRRRRERRRFRAH